MNSNVVILILLVIGLGSGWAAFWPWTKCGKCKGRGRFGGPFGYEWRDCPRCGGAGRKLRFLSGMMRPTLAREQSERQRRVREQRRRRR
jgi:DnaJ-class molecular chaperone